MNKRKTLFAGILLSMLIPVANAVIIQADVKGSDAIWLAGRTDLDIPPAGEPWSDGLIRHEVTTPEEIEETLPAGFSVSEGDIIKVLNPADGGISFVLGFGGRIFSPDGNDAAGSSVIESFGGISGYSATKGALVGVFLNDDIPNGEAPETLDFSNSGLGINFITLSPELGQVFFIGDGVTSDNVAQEFTAPAGATRLFLGVPDSFGFSGAPSAFDDNDGFYTIRFGINEGLDNDSDGILDSWELAFGLDPTNFDDAAEDPDMDGFTNLEEFQAGTDPFGISAVAECTLDVDGDANVNALTDGLLFIRQMFGIHGESLVEGAVGTDCTRCSASEIELFLDQCATSLASDIDDNGEADALSDGLLIIRYVFGIRDAALINNSVGDGCNRCTAAEIEDYLEGLIPEPDSP